MPSPRGAAPAQSGVGPGVTVGSRNGVIEEESEGRYRITSVVEIVLSSERLRELVEWLSEQRPEEIDTEDIDADDDAAVPTEDEEPAS